MLLCLCTYVCVSAHAGTFPAWLVTNVPQLVASCQCSVGVNLDGPKFSCPKSLPRLTRQAQTILHRFESLQCITDDTRLKGLDSRQLIPIWVAAAGPGQRPLMSRAEHKQALQWHFEGQQGQPGAATQQQQQQQHGWQQRHRVKGTAAVMGVLAAAVLAAAAALMVMKLQQHKQRSTDRQVSTTPSAWVDPAFRIHFVGLLQ